MSDEPALQPPASTGVGGQVRRIAAGAAILSLGNVASRLLGLARESVIASLFGLTGLTSAFTTASRVTTQTYDLLISGAISSALVPTFSEYAAAGRWDELWRVASTVLTLVVVLLVLATGALMALAPYLVDLLGPEPTHQLFPLTVQLTILALPSVVFLGVAGVLSALLYARQRFALPAFATATFNAGVIVAAVALGPTPLGIASLSLGLVLGALCQMGLQLLGLREFRYRPRLDLGHPAVRAILRLYLPVAAGLVVSTAGVVIDTALAWRAGEESLAAMRFATNLVQLPLGLVAVATSLAALPALSRVRGADYGATLQATVRMVLLLMVPATVALVALRHPVVQVLFERGAFDAAGTARAALVFLAYSPQIPFAALDQLLIVAFYARKDTRTPVLVGVVTVGLYLLVALLLVDAWGAAGLALANAVQNSAHAVVLFALLRRAVPSLGRGLPAYVGALAVAAALMGGVLVGASHLVPVHAAGSLAERVGLLALLGGCGGAVYLAALRLLHVPEATALLRLARRGPVSGARRAP
jgi:putative peptidoglycan lipid II flippase